MSRERGHRRKGLFGWLRDSLGHGYRDEHGGGHGYRDEHGGGHGYRDEHRGGHGYRRGHH
ncbi:hypothetical protein [Mycobacterium intracellulare]|uniref:hypothetical protein n=1 Tax=Mycobacterium intracellulare TaxID=1767 RepID=UPI000BB0412E|nr:hypothetical protein [Mycobacterium intracellulare]PBA53203.1 hypothetical protein CKJ57_27170 [Mycobacterium intracellulare subsp. chimaera]